VALTGPETVGLILLLALGAYGLLRGVLRLDEHEEVMPVGGGSVPYMMRAVERPVTSDAWEGRTGPLTAPYNWEEES
jgi:hypothetical protein